MNDVAERLAHEGRPGIRERKGAAAIDFNAAGGVEIPGGLPQEIHLRARARVNPSGVAMVRVGNGSGGIAEGEMRIAVEIIALEDHVPNVNRIPTDEPIAPAVESQAKLGKAAGRLDLARVAAVSHFFDSKTDIGIRQLDCLGRGLVWKSDRTVRTSVGRVNPIVQSNFEAVDA